MTHKKQFQQLPLWREPKGSEMDLPASRRQELTTALADLLWQFATAQPPDHQEQGGSIEYGQQQDHA